LLKVICRGDMPVGDYKDMRGGKGVDVMEGSHHFIVMQDPGRGFTLDYLTEDARHGCFREGLMRRVPFWA
jgi:hypothetical protein